MTNKAKHAYRHWIGLVWSSILPYLITRNIIVAVVIGYLVEYVFHRFGWCVRENKGAK